MRQLVLSKKEINSKQFVQGKKGDQRKEKSKENPSKGTRRCDSDTGEQHFSFGHVEKNQRGWAAKKDAQSGGEEP